MRSSLLVLAATFLAACPPPAPSGDTGPEEEPIVPGTETVSVSWDVDLFDDTYESPKIQRFDTMDGRRKLDAMTIAVDHSAEMTVALENGSTFALSASDYSAEFYLQSIIQLGLEEDAPDDEGTPFFGPGAFQVVLAEDLAAADETEEAGDDYHVVTATDEIQFEAGYDRVETERYLEVMTGEDELQLVVGGFSEMWVYWVNEYDGEALLYAGATAVQYAGTMTVTYEYSAAEE